MNKVYINDIISIIHFIIKKDPYDNRHQESCWQFRKLTNGEIEIKPTLKVQHVWRIESNTDADAIIEGTGVQDKTKPETELNKVLFLVLELCN